MNSNYSITNAPLTNLLRPTALGKSPNYHCPSANILAAILPRFLLLFIPDPLRGRKCKRKKRSCNAINKAGKQPFKSPLFCYCAVAIVVRPEALANLPPRIARHHRPTITILFSPLSLLFFSFLRPRGMISAKEGGEGKKKRKKTFEGKGGKGV